MTVAAATLNTVTKSSFRVSVAVSVPLLSALCLLCFSEAVLGHSTGQALMLIFPLCIVLLGNGLNYT